MAKPKKGAELERLFEGYLWWLGWTSHRAAAAGFHRFAKVSGGEGFSVKSHDLFGCLDFLAFHAEAYPERVWAVQCTTTGGLTKRRRKLEAVKWPKCMRVSLVTHERVRCDPLEPHAVRGWIDRFVVQDYDHATGTWEKRRSYLGFSKKRLEEVRRARRAEEQARKAEERAGR